MCVEGETATVVRGGTLRVFVGESFVDSSVSDVKSGHRIGLNLDYLVTLYVPNVNTRHEFELISNSWKQRVRSVRGYQPRQTFHFLCVFLICFFLCIRPCNVSEYNSFTQSHNEKKHNLAENKAPRSGVLSRVVHPGNFCDQVS